MYENKRRDLFQISREVAALKNGVADNNDNKTNPKDGPLKFKGNVFFLSSLIFLLSFIPFVLVYPALVYPVFSSHPFQQL